MIASLLEKLPTPVTGWTGPATRPDGTPSPGVGFAFGVFLLAQIAFLTWAVIAYGVLGSTDAGEGAPSDGPLWWLPVVNAGLWLAYALFPIIADRATTLARAVAAPGGSRLRFGNPIFDYSIAAIAGALCQLAVLPVLYWPLLKFVDGDPSEQAKELVAKADGGLELIVLAFSVVVMAPLSEEVMFRGFLLRIVSRRFGGLIGAVSVSALFAAVHFIPLAFLGLFVFALVASAILALTGRLGAAMVAHAAFNLVAMIGLL